MRVVQWRFDELLGKLRGALLDVRVFEVMHQDRKVALAVLVKDALGQLNGFVFAVDLIRGLLRQVGDELDGLFQVFVVGHRRLGRHIGVAEVAHRGLGAFFVDGHVVVLVGVAVVRVEKLPVRTGGQGNHRSGEGS